MPSTRWAIGRGSDCRRGYLGEHDAARTRDGGGTYPAAAMAAKKEKEVTPPAQMSGKKRKSSVMETEGAGPSKRPMRPSNTRVISNSRRNLPGAFGDDSDEDEERPAPQEEARAKKPRLSYAEAPQDPEEQARKEREREAVKRRLEVNKARRRSSAGVKGRASIGKREWQLSA